MRAHRQAGRVLGALAVPLVLAGALTGPGPAVPFSLVFEARP
jgi:hypothetical protein